MTIYYVDYINGLDANAGTSWGTAWKTLTLGATLARIAPGDVIRIAKSPAPTSIGNATWNNLSKTVTLATAQTLAVDQCETAWTANTNVTATRTTTTRKQGSYEASLAIGASFTTGKVAYRATGTLNLSAYQKLTFWFRTNLAIASGNVLRVVLCSDTAGETPVDTFYIPAIPSTGRYIPLTIARVGGGNLGASIQSIAVYADSDPGTITILLDNITACTTSGLNLQSLISKNTLEQSTISSTGYGNEAWYGIQSIVGTTILLDNETNTLANAGRGYFGTTETVTTYKRETIPTELASTSTTAVQSVMDSGTAGNLIEFQGGYDTGTGLQTGETFFDGLNGYGYGIDIVTKSYVKLNHISAVRYGIGIRQYTNCSYITLDTISDLNNNTTYGLYLSGTSYATISNSINSNNNGYGTWLSDITYGTITNAGNCNNNLNNGFYLSDSSYNSIDVISNSSNNASTGIELGGTAGCFFNTINTITKCHSNGNNQGIRFNYAADNYIGTITSVSLHSASSGIDFYSSQRNIIDTATSTSNAYGVYFNNSSNCLIRNFTSSGNTTSAIGAIYGEGYILNATCTDTTKWYTSAISGGYVKILKFNGNYSKMFTNGGNIVSQASTLTNGSGTEWMFTTETNTNRKSDYPLKMSIAKIAVNANSLVTVSGWFKKGHATNIGARLMCKGGQLSGVTSDVYATKADNTAEEQLTITFTPTESGVIEITAEAFYVAGHSTVIVDALTITQA